MNPVSRSSKLTFAGILSVFSIAAIGAADAATVGRFFFQNAGSACTGARPTYEGALRKRPLAIANEGDVPAFVTCSPTADANGANGKSALTFATNHGTTAIELNCTLVNGNELDSALYTPQTKILQPGEAAGIGWTPTLPATTFPKPGLGISCTLPPNVELSFFGYTVDEDVG